ncbi:ABC transporter permease [Cellulosilyticum lentocellum]|uniref:ABC3 transporter permease C-terminal domain-containing protein n=1 Tax=Cellulosilyticum lentocellum (strain ATCC 49066 / DSM 5427 / NCIMB 11756 / RHM5) TaxID=642492 RepID=F2JNR5_CELLD|nr:ABC transporter permease [Cellulosilyticum lentocellum]ADZ82413.1 protein of unknown function DUF214 [Cellulosilyticum lentocellum DSM 5427]
MFKVQNTKAIRNLAKRNYESNKKRNQIAIMAIILTTILFTTLFTLGAGIIKSMEYNNMRMAGGSAHASLKYLSEEEYQKLSGHPLIEKIGKSIFVGQVEDIALSKRPVEIDYCDKVSAELGFIELKEGTFPRDKDQIVLDDLTLKRLGITPKVGEKVSLSIDFNDRIETVDFTLSGWYEGDPAFTVGIGLVSESFVKAYLPGRGQAVKKDNDINGSIRADLYFKNSRNIEGNVQKVITDSGYSMEEDADNRIYYGVNWSYMSASLDHNIGSIVAVVLGIVLIMLTGYLIIYNTFQISVIKEIRFYGLLKTIGTTGRQIKSMIKQEAFRMCLWGIPLGLILGFGMGALFLPLLTAHMQGGKSSLSFSPMIFIGSAVFAMITVLLSCNKPAKVAAKITPVEAVKWSGVDQNYTQKQKRTNGSKLYQMALANLSRNRKRTIIAIISMSLSLVLMNAVFCLANSFDMNKFVSKFIDCDFQVAHASYFNNDYRQEQKEVDDELVAALVAQPTFAGGGGVYTPMGIEIRAEYEGEVNFYGQHMHFDKTQGIYTGIYAMDDFNLEGLDIVKGELDIEKFKSGNYLLLGLMDDDYGNILYDEALYDIGDKVKLKVLEDILTDPNLNDFDKDTGIAYDQQGKVIERPITEVYGREKEYEIMGFYRMTYTNTSRTYADLVTFAMPVEELKTYTPQISRMTYLCESIEGEEAQIELFLKNYTEAVNQTMNYCSRESYKQDFFEFRNVLVLVGGALCLIIGLIGLLNFINAMSTSIIARQKEFAMLKSIGMTKKQLLSMLTFEGIYYAIYTSVASLIITLLISYTALKNLTKAIWFLSFELTVAPLLIACTLLFILTALIPGWSYHTNNKNAIVEELKDSE